VLVAVGGGCQVDLDLLQDVAVAGRIVAVLAYLDQVLGQHVLQEAPDELFDRQPAVLGLATIALFVGFSSVWMRLLLSAGALWVRKT
jgi:hypothetical protein